MVKVAEVVKKPKGVLEGYAFPKDAYVNEEKYWNIRVHNGGDGSGDVAGGITNLKGNPGDIVIIYGGTEYPVKPGETMLFYTWLDPCGRISPEGKVKFMAAGDYTIRLGAWHREDTDWILDMYADVG